MPTYDESTMLLNGFSLVCLSDDDGADFTCEPIAIQLDEGDNSTWIHAMRPGSYKHAIYGKLDFTETKLRQFAGSVNNRARGIVPDIDFDHKRFSGEAAGWLDEARVDHDGLWLKAEFTDDAADAIRKGKYKYFSPEFAQKWKNPQTGKEIRDVLTGGALTNRPFLKDLKPVTLDEGGGMDELLKALRQHLQLDENAGEEAVTKALNEYFSSTGSGGAGGSETVNLSEAKIDRKEDKVVVTHSGAEGQLEIELDDGDDPLAQLREINPKLAEQMEDQAKQIQNLEAANKMTEVTHQLDEIGGSEKALAPAVVDSLKPILVRMSDDNRKTVLTALDQMVKDGIVDLSQHSAGSGGGSHKGTGGSGDPVSEVDSKARKLMESDDEMSYGDAVRKVSLDEPELYESYVRAVNSGSE